MRSNLLSMAAIFAIGVAFVSCKSKDVYDEENISNLKQQDLKAEYNAAFVQQFGTIHPNHQWGFGEGSTTRAASIHNYDKYELPDEIKNSVGKNFAKPFNKSKDTVKYVAYQEYFLQHVYKQTNNGKDNTQGNTSDTHHKLLQLQAYNFNTNEWEDVTNFDGGKDVHHMTDMENHKMTKGVTLMTNMGTPVKGQKMFRWLGDDNFVCDNYIIKEIDGEYYLGLGYDNKNTKDYDAWIIKIVKAVGIPDYKERGRIMCEDLGEIGDFDFNDVVFDATIMNDGSINIVIQAAGGTLGVSVAEVPVTLGVMTNTGVYENDQLQKFTISAETALKNGWTTLKSIPVEVIGKDGVKYELTAEYGEAPGKICTFIGLPWADEYVNIKDAYKGFASWVKEDQPVTWWEEHMSEILTDLDLSNNPAKN